MATVEPFSATELRDLESFVSDELENGTSRFTQSLDILIERFWATSNTEVRMNLRSVDTGRKVILEIRCVDFAQRAEDSDLDSSDFPLSHRVFEMTVALTEFGHMTDFEAFEDGTVLRVLPYGRYLEFSTP